MKVFHIQKIQIVIFLSSILSTFGAHALEREKSVANCAGEVVTVRGTVLVRQDAAEGKAKEPLELKAGNNVYPGDVINTASDGAVKILLKDKTIVDLGGSALFKVAQFKPNEGANRQVELDMMFGKMRVAVPKKLEGEGKFQIKTRAATMGVRGTEFVVTSALETTATATEKAAPPQTSVVVLQGKVDVAKPGEANAAAPMHLTAGNQITTQVGAPTGAMVKLNENQMGAVATASKVTDNTFTKAVTIEAAPAQRSSAPANNSSTAANSSSSSSSTRAPAEAGGGNGSGSTSAASAATAAVASAPLAGSLQSSVASIAAEVPTVSVSFSELGVPGAPSVVNTATAATVTQKQSSYHLNVVVTAQ